MGPRERLIRELGHALQEPRGDAATLAVEHGLAQDEFEQEREEFDDELDAEDNWFGSWHY